MIGLKYHDLVSRMAPILILVF